MYLMGTHIPIYLDGDDTYVDDSWFSDLDLARRFFAPHFGPIHLIGPSLPLSSANTTQVVRVDHEVADIHLHPSIPADIRIRRFWPEGSRQWRRDLAPLIEQARVVHASVDDPFLPMQLATLRAGVEAGKVTVLIGFDMDVWNLLPTQLAQMGRAQGMLHVARTIGMDFWMRRMLPRVSVAMLKEGLVHDRYSRLARNPKEFCHSMFSASDVISKQALSERLASMQTGRPLRLAYFGRFVERKGLADGIRILAAARQQGLEASYHLIGEGPQQADLERLATELGVADCVVFEGQFPYGPSLHEKLRTFDALLFPPTEEDTPRMVYDAYAAGMPLITSDIAFLRRRAESDGASRLFPIGGMKAAADILLELSADRDQLAALSEAAHEAATRHSIEHWYGKRLEWTLEAAERQRVLDR